MLRKLLQPLSLLLVAILITQASCATATLGIFGAIYNVSTPESKSISPSRANRLVAGNRVALFLRDSTVVRGRIAGARDATDEELRVIYRQVAATGPEGMRVPLPGDTLLVSTERVRSWVRFCRLANTGPGAEAEFVSGPGGVLQVQLGGGVVPITVPLLEVQSVQWPDSTTLSGTDLVRMCEGRIPSQPRLLSVETEPGGTVDVRSWDAVRVEIYPWRRATAMGVGIGLLLDTAFWAYLYTHPPVIG